VAALTGPPTRVSWSTARYQAPRAAAPAPTLRRVVRGAGWHTGQKNEERFMKEILRIGVPQRVQGSPSRP
jgi:hypothetical protein